MVEVFGRENNDVQRQPAADEYRHHRYQHAIRATFSLDLGLIASTSATNNRRKPTYSVIGCLHDKANMKQT